MLAKRRVTGGKVRVSFSLPGELDAEQVAVCGEFTDWEPTIAMKRSKTGEWKASVVLEAGRRYRFRYLLNGVRWENDPGADDSEPNPYGGDDSVVQV